MSATDEHNGGGVVLYCSPAGDVSLEVRLDHDSVWLTQRQMAELFCRDQSVISRHLRRALAADELSPESTMQKVHIAGSDKPVVLYDLDAVISVGYRVDSARGTQFRIWATAVCIGAIASRAPAAKLEAGMLMAAVAESEKVGKSAWIRGHFGLMPLPDLTAPNVLCVAKLDDVGKAVTQDVLAGTRIACLSPYGVNLLQQRFIWRLARFEVPTHKLHEVSAHVFEEADLLEEWSEEVCGGGVPPEQAAADFEAFLRADRGGGRSLQDDLRDPQLRSTVRAACRAEARRRSRVS